MLLHALYERLCTASLNRLPCYGALEVIVTLLLLLLWHFFVTQSSRTNITPSIQCQQSSCSYQHAVTINSTVPNRSQHLTNGVTICVHNARCSFARIWRWWLPCSRTRTSYQGSTTSRTCYNQFRTQMMLPYSGNLLLCKLNGFTPVSQQPRAILRGTCFSGSNVCGQISMHPWVEVAPRCVLPNNNQGWEYY